MQENFYFEENYQIEDIDLDKDDWNQITKNHDFINHSEL